MSRYMHALGMTNREARVLLAGAFAPALGAGVVLAACARGSRVPRFPVGVARRVDPDLGVHFDGTVLLLGAAGLTVLLAGIAWLSAHRAVATSGRGRRGPAVSMSLDRIVGWLAPAPRTGVRLRLRRAARRIRARTVGAGRRNRRGRRAGRGRCGRVEHRPAARDARALGSELGRGRWDLAPDGAGDPKSIADNRDMAAAAIGTFDDRVEVADHGALAMVLEPITGSTRPSVVSGHEAHAADEVAIGTRHAKRRGRRDR